MLKRPVAVKCLIMLSSQEMRINTIDKQLIGKCLNQHTLKAVFNVLKDNLYVRNVKKSKIRVYRVFQKFTTQIRKQLQNKVALYRTEALINERIQKWTYEYWRARFYEARCRNQQFYIAAEHH